MLLDELREITTVAKLKDDVNVSLSALNHGIN